MFPDHWTAKEPVRFTFEGLKNSNFKEKFLDSTEQKIFQKDVKRRADAYKILFEINLQERRGKLRQLLSEEEQQMIEEHENKVVTLEQRRQKLMELSKNIRYQKEVERQALAKEKYFERDRLNDDEIRRIQQEKHTKEIVKDWDKLKNFQKRVEREERCESKFWNEKAREENNKMLEREMREQDKNNRVSNDIIAQMREREAERGRLKKERLEEQRFNQQNSQDLEEYLKKEAIEVSARLHAQQANYRASLDKHIKIRKCKEHKDKEQERAFDNIMKDENEVKMKIISFEEGKKKIETMKHIKNYGDLSKCIEKERKSDEIRINELVTKTQIENEKKALKFERDKNKKYQDLIKSIKAAQKDQLKVAQLQKDEIAKEREAERLATQISIAESLEIEKIEKEAAKRKVLDHHNMLCGQLEFNEHLRDLKNREAKKEIEDMKAEEHRHIELLKYIKDNETLLYLHPWRKEQN